MLKTPVQSRIEEVPVSTSPEISVNTKLSKRSSENRVLNLDVLRGIAILLVLVSHQVYTPGQGVFRNFTDRLHVVGQSGVDLFFVLSGFLIGGLLLTELRETGRLDVRRFLIRRAFKIWPPYFALLAVATIQLIRHDSYTLQSAIQKMWPFVLSLQNYIGPWDVITQTWSLAVEEHFYLALPFALLYLNTRGPNSRTIWQSLPIVVISFLIICNLFRLGGYVFGAYPVSGYNTHVRVDALFCGVFLNYLHTHCESVRSRVESHTLSVFALGCVLVTLRFCLPEYSFFVAMQFTLLYIGYGLCLFAVMNLPEDGAFDRLMKCRLSRLVAFVGLYSYSIYLWHFEFAGPFVMAKVIPHLPDALKWPVGMIVYISLGIVTGIILGRLIDSPVLAFRNKVFPSRVARIHS